MKILTLSTRRQTSPNGVLDETTTANTRGRNSCAHARSCKFTSGSRPSSPRRPILRSHSPSRAERKNRPRESWPHERCCLGERRKNGTTDKAPAFDLSRPSDFMVFISNLINRNPIISLILTACQFWSVIAFIAVKH